MNAQLLESVCLHESTSTEEADYVLIDADFDDDTTNRVGPVTTAEKVNLNFDDEADHCEDTDIFLPSKWNVPGIEEDFSVLADVCEDKEQYDSARTSNFECSLTFVSDDEDEDLSIAAISILKDDDVSVASVVTTASQTGKRSSSTSCGSSSASASAGSRLCNKKRRRKMKKLKKEAAAAAAAERLMKQNARTGTNLDDQERERKSAQLAVACATKTLAAYKEEQEKQDQASKGAKP